jgi:hypothetical protein
LAAVAMRMPTKPAIAENTAPRIRASEPQGRIVGRTKRTTLSTDDEDRDRAVLAAQERHGALADREGDLLHDVVARAAAFTTLAK